MHIHEPHTSLQWISRTNMRRDEVTWCDLFSATSGWFEFNLLAFLAGSKKVPDRRPADLLLAALATTNSGSLSLSWTVLLGLCTKR